MNTTAPTTRSLRSLSIVRCALAAIAVAGGLLGAVACGSSVQPETATSTDQAALTAGSPGGHMHVLTRSALALSLRPDQRATITTLDAKIDTDAAPVQDARTKLHAALAQQIRDGKLDHAALKPLAQQVDAAIAALEPSLQASTQALHDALDGGQRKELVAAVRSHHTSPHAAMKARFQELATELGLSEDQKATIHAALKQTFAAHADEARATHEQMRARMESLATAFEADGFDAKALGVGSHLSDGSRVLMGVHGAFLDAALPVLTPAQRATLADRIQAHGAGQE